ncbi:MAG: substrate binding domain-containing protein, partial [Myxococcota bacterium]
ISASFVFGAFMVRALPRFFARYPGLEVDLRLTDRRVRLVREDVDIALRIGRLTDSELVGRKLRDASWRLVASPTYLAARGTPRERSDLAKHDAVLFRTPRGKVKPIALADGVAPTRNRLCLDQGPLVLDAAVAGLGIAQVFDFMCESAISRGELLSLLPDHMPAAEPIFALTTKARRRHPRVRVALDFLSEILSTVHGPLTQHG